MNCGIGLRHSLDPGLLWLWHRLAAAAPIQPLAWALPYTVGMRLERQKKRKEKKKEKKQGLKGFKQLSLRSRTRGVGDGVGGMQKSLLFLIGPAWGLIWLINCGWKKCIMWELWLKFYRGKNEDYSPGDSLSGSPEELLQRTRGEVSVMYDFGEGGYVQSSTGFGRGLLLVMRSRYHR